MEHAGERRGLGPFSVAPIGFGAMRLTGPNVFGPPPDHRDAIRGVIADDEPRQLRRAIEENLRTLAVEALPVVNLRLMRNSEPDALFDDQLGAMISARDDGLINSIGLSNISHAHLLRALKVTAIACVQNFFHVANRTSQPVLEECTRRGI